MGLFTGFRNRMKYLTTPRGGAGTGRLWDNINGGNVGIRSPQTTITSSNSMYPNENYFVPGPNPEPYLHGMGWKDPNRLHGPVPHMQPEIPVTEPRSPVGALQTYNDPIQPGSPGLPGVISPMSPVVGIAPPMILQREHEKGATPWDAGNPGVLRTPQSYTPSQRYFNERIPLPEYTTPSVPAHSVQVPPLTSQRGWVQAFVPEPGMQFPEIGVAPPYKLSTPIQSKTRIIENNLRTPISKAKAPKRQRSGG